MVIDLFKEVVASVSTRVDAKPFQQPRTQLHIQPKQMTESYEEQK